MCMCVKTGCAQRLTVLHLPSETVDDPHSPFCFSLIFKRIYTFWVRLYGDPHKAKEAEEKTERRHMVVHRRSILRRGFYCSSNGLFSPFSVSQQRLHHAVDQQRRLEFQEFIRRESAPFTGCDPNDCTKQKQRQQWQGEENEVNAAQKRHVLDLIEVRPVPCALEGSGNSDANGQSGREGMKTNSGSARGMQPSNSFGRAQTGNSRENQQCHGRRNADDPHLRGKRDLHSLQLRAKRHIRVKKENQLGEEYRQALSTLRDVFAALQASAMRHATAQDGCGGPNQDGDGASRGGHDNGGRMMLSEAVRFQRLHQLRDATCRLTTSHFLQVPKSCVLEFLDLVSRIVTVVGNTPMTAHGYVVRQAVRALFMQSMGEGSSAFVRRSCGEAKAHYSSSSEPRQGTFHPVHYFKLLRVMLSLPSEDTLQLCNSAGTPMSVEEFCVRQLYGEGNGATSSARGISSKFGSLRELGSVRAVRVVSWCMHSVCSTPVLSPSQRHSYTSVSSLPPVSELRIPFGVGKEYTQTLLACFAHPVSSSSTGSSNHSTSRREQTYSEYANGTQLPERLPFSVKELAVLCSAIVYYKITTMEALTVLVSAATVCALRADELSGHQLSCMLLAYATLKYHGDLTRHVESIGAKFPPSRICSVGQEGQTNFYLLLGERACELGEGLHENDAARVLRALELSGVEHEMLRNSLTSGMRMKRLRSRALLAGR
ncbi:hypothetical protein, conserved [Trypanosoma brucei gambiense DAL972]|uniref:Uncharacterized protein n=1 Tax=Trypanosoma brucei gambiense (strain MHOM/CI/86/DAL972) TaxID=679716 RepID=C9ZJ14_TRYB9|nr:hypothetical protein, conserved [Trypanosoma brucei gambiense DAL972]CBH09372.1 hypothetical protein, conserved [Trypanosoma brucei gambiense DAL972]|eukprot:XP_011771678.1 hypothetical protein, conserved [Trypanosoma brucei gambiense DAL972]